MVSIDGSKQKLSESGGGPLEGAEELGAASEGPGTVGSHPMGLWGVFQGSGTGGAYIWIGYMGFDPRMGQALGIFQHRVVRKIIGRKPKRGEDGSW